ncbi:hypothetical protein [Couchioplanes azureus]|uniref:hypothetical protein n=1 Tax=Couchioplanes caeruleus TaxID=56438 RepID=UPI00167043CE|nr:hypothetical protein [Couchioplanes caeruleus]GGQ88308.1 hypothetical protein GCM10010166_67850 [Couchioplanes caeruleus subsp. azureus]
MKVKASKTALVGVVAFLGFAVVMAAIEYLAFRGQIAFGRHYMHLSGAGLAATYLALQGGMLASAALGLWAVLSRDGYLGHRFWTALFLAAAALADFLGAKAAGWPTTGALYVAGFSFAALRLWHAILRRLRRDMSPQYPLLRFPLLRWVLAFGETRKAFRVSYLDGLSPVEALTRVRGELAPPPALLTEDGQDVRKLSKSEAIEAAFSAVGSYDVAAATAWLGERGVTANRSTFYDVRDRMTAARRAELHAVTPTKALTTAPAAAQASATKTPARKAPARKATPAAADAVVAPEKVS